MKKVLWRAAIVAALALAAAQFYQPSRANPPADPAVSFAAVANPPKEVVAIVDRSCRDCHTHNTVWPWYSTISPVSWLVAGDVEKGRRKLNFSQWNLYGPEMSRIRMTEVCEEVKAGKMPLPYYTPLHPESRLSSRDVESVCAAVR